MKFSIARSIALHVAVIALLVIASGCSTVAGVGQDVQDVANWSRNKIVEKANQPKQEVQVQRLSEEEIQEIESDIEEQI